MHYFLSYFEMLCAIRYIVMVKLYKYNGTTLQSYEVVQILEEFISFAPGPPIPGGPATLIAWVHAWSIDLLVGVV